MTTSITKRLEFDSAHRVLGHEGKCATIHGHRYAAEITVTAAGLDGIGRVVDFGVVKRVVGDWINKNWDHNLLLNSADPLWAVSDLVGLNNGKLPFLFEYSNPTAEVIAEKLFHVTEHLLAAELTVLRVRIYETPSAWADYPVPLPPV